MARRIAPFIGISQLARVPRKRGKGARRASSPAVAVVEITDPTAADAGIEVLSQELVQLETRPVRARRLVVRLEDSLVVFHSTNLRVRTSTTVRDRLLAYVVIGPQARGAGTSRPLACRMATPAKRHATSKGRRQGRGGTGPFQQRKCS